MIADQPSLRVFLVGSQCVLFVPAGHSLAQQSMRALDRQYYQSLFKDGSARIALTFPNLLCQTTLRARRQQSTLCARGRLERLGNIILQYKGQKGLALHCWQHYLTISYTMCKGVGQKGLATSSYNMDSGTLCTRGKGQKGLPLHCWQHRLTI